MGEIYLAAARKNGLPKTRGVSFFGAGVFILAIFLCAASARAEVLFQDDFNGWTDFTIPQNVSESENCYTNCSLAGNWTAYNTYRTHCGTGITGRPGNNSIYVNSVSGYPLGGGTCRGGSGKCFTKWQEACLAPNTNFDDADANFGVDLGSEHDELYLRFFIKFPTSFVLNDGQAFKLFHLQHYNGGGATPWNYFGRDTNNQPVTAGGIRRADGNYVDIYAEARGYPKYYIHNPMFWRIETYSAAIAPGGILDGNWHSIELRQKMNSAVGVSDGIMEAWVDGNKLGNWADYPTNTINWNNIPTTTRTDISFNAQTKTISSTGGDLSNQIFVAELPIVVSGSVRNNGTYTIVSRANTHEVTVAENILDESAGASVTIRQTPPEVRGFRFVSISGNNMSWTTACSDGNGSMSECEQWYSIDDPVVSTTYIGPSYVIGSGPPPDTDPPVSPANLNVR